jgi:hypothetical protein
VTSSQKSLPTIAGVLLLIAGVVIAGIFYGDVMLTVVGGVTAVIGLALLRYAMLRRRRLARG